MKTFITRSIFITSILLIFVGLSVSADNDSWFGGNSLPELPTSDAGIFDDPSGKPERSWFTTGGGSGGELDLGFGEGRGFGDGDGDGGGFDEGADENPSDCSYNDCPIGGGVYILMLLASAYGLFLVRRKKELA